MTVAFQPSIAHRDEYRENLYFAVFVAIAVQLLAKRFSAVPVRFGPEFFLRGLEPDRYGDAHNE